MLTLMDQVLDPVAVVDDDAQAAKRIVYQLEDMGATDCRVIRPSDPTMEGMLRQVEDCNLVVCDHKLNQAFRVDYYGVDLVAEAARRHQAGVLISGQLPDEMHRIRARLAEVPAFWPREGGLDDFARQVEAAAALKAGHPLAESRFYRAIVEIDDLLRSGLHAVARVRILGWVTPETLDVPVQLLDPNGNHGQGLVGNAVAAEVNLLEPNPQRVRIRNAEPDLVVADRLLQDSDA